MIQAALLLLSGAVLTSQQPTPPQFRLSYVGQVDRSLGSVVLGRLRTTYREYEERFGFGPSGVIRVVLTGEAAFSPSRFPDWAAGINDGTIRVPIRGLEEPSASLDRLIRHELAHSFLSSKTGGNCPTWLQEGVAQWLEGGDPEREDDGVAETLVAGDLLALYTLEAPFYERDEPDVRLAYAASLSATAHLLRTRGVQGLIRLIESLGAGVPSDDALSQAIGMSYADFQRTWEQHLTALARRD